jgi:hypothetical protein
MFLALPGNSSDCARIMKQVILLAGLHKTATTSIQQTCSANRQVLREAGFHYPSVHSGDGLDSNHTSMLKELFRASPNRVGLAGKFTTGQDLDAYGQEQRRAGFAARLSRQTGRLLLAAEGVSVFTEPELQGMKLWFAERGYSMRVICHVRHLASWAQSMLAQRVVGPIALTLAEAVDEFVAVGGIVRPRIEAIRRTFPDAEFYSHERAVRFPNGPAAFFFKVIGFPMGVQFRVIRANEGRSDVATRVVALINERFGRSRWAGSPEGLQAHLWGPAMQAMRALPGPKFTLRRDEVAPILPMLERENDWLRDTLGKEFYDDRLEFGEGASGWTPESMRLFQEGLQLCEPTLRDWVTSNLQRVDLPLAAGQ